MKEKEKSVGSSRGDLGVRVVLVEPEIGGNIGSVARIMKNFGFRDLVLVNPKVSLTDNEVERFAMHAKDILEGARVVGSIDEAIENIDIVIGTSARIAKGDYNLLRTAITLNHLENFGKICGSAAILFGKESAGLTNKEVEKCDFLLTIESSKEYRALNLSHAVAIILYSFYRMEKHTDKKEIYRPANREEREILMKTFESLVDALGLKPHKKRTAINSFKNVIGRSFITGRELHTLVGSFRKATKTIKELKKD